MGAYIVRRLLMGIPTVLGVLLLLYILFFLVAKPRDIAKRALTDKASEEQVLKWLENHGYGKIVEITGEDGAKKDVLEPTPKPVLLANYFTRMLTFKFGKADLDDVLISEKLRKGVGPSLALTLPAFAVGVFASIAISLLVALFRDTYVDRITLVLCVVGMSIVVFVYIIGGQFFLGKVLRWHPISGWDPHYKLHFLMLPIVVGTLAGLGERIRFYRTIMINEISSDYIRTARAKGVSDTALLFKHLLKNAMIPILTGLVMAIPFLFLGALLLESFFGIPGLGRLTVEAITNNDFSTTSAMVYITSLLYIIFNLLTDISYTFVDPRVRLR